MTVPNIDNEPVLQFAPGSEERVAVEKVHVVDETQIYTVDQLDTVNILLQGVIIALNMSLWT